MTEKEIDIVAEELARMGGNAWYPGRGQDPVLRVVSERYRDRARAVIAALDRYRQYPSASATDPGPSVGEKGRLRPGTTLIYRPPGDRRAYACIVDQVSDDAVHVIPQMPGSDGWIREPGMVTPEVIRSLDRPPSSVGLPQDPPDAPLTPMGR